MAETPKKSNARRRINSLNSLIRNAARQNSRSADSVRYQIVFEAFLRRVFHNASTPWVLTGGASLLLRNSQGRFTIDLDLARAQQWNSLQSLEKELEHICQIDDGDGFSFEIRRLALLRDEDVEGYIGPSVDVQIIVRIGAQEFANFKIDITTQRHTQAPIEQIKVAPLLNSVGKTIIYADDFYIYSPPIGSQLADKICAMYEVHGSQNRPSTRYHDLMDIVTMTSTQTIDGRVFINALHHESSRRGVELPEKLVSPSKDWDARYYSQATKQAPFPKELHSLEASLDYAGRCINPALRGQIQDETWNPEKQSWQ
ncbi:nucleotidyl transferase AbiEii/AbiGii toxin family protein [Corynebacterium renale]|uniref:Nucleotidyltransferase AbiEii toxin of type IV toxin-antitoxin system n=1 Tax=Corynebacterium renale TaxID=1724 RepID=A0A2A9DPC8_9CORY|nr:nucleotidyl transferase AbiEii/AbiGii toxin family protein [Corynebacterium renale]PFG27769.1 nucleotidyltransferase AbiEii toxin of type IV toxin-antitoxin system [Corynebacterium renale]SQI22117.1 Nucleotidyl transferase of uncharacterised function (DUF1814) [Corynebacterium renale]